MTTVCIWILSLFFTVTQGMNYTSHNQQCNRTLVLEEIKSYLESDSVAPALRRLTYNTPDFFGPEIIWQNLQGLEDICSSLPATYARIYCTEEGFKKVPAAISDYWRTRGGANAKKYAQVGNLTSYFLGFDNALYFADAPHYCNKVPEASELPYPQDFDVLELDRIVGALVTPTNRTTEFQWLPPLNLSKEIQEVVQEKMEREEGSESFLP